MQTSVATSVIQDLLHVAPLGNAAMMAHCIGQIAAQAQLLQQHNETSQKQCQLFYFVSCLATEVKNLVK